MSQRQPEARRAGGCHTPGFCTRECYLASCSRHQAIFSATVVGSGPPADLRASRRPTFRRRSLRRSRPARLRRFRFAASTSRFRHRRRRGVRQPCRGRSFFARAAARMSAVLSFPLAAGAAAAAALAAAGLAGRGALAREAACGAAGRPLCRPAAPPECRPSRPCPAGLAAAGLARFGSRRCSRFGGRRGLLFGGGGGLLGRCFWPWPPAWAGAR